MTIGVMIACNHWRNGSFRGVVTNFQFDRGREHIYLESPYYDAGLRMGYASEPGSYRNGGLLVFGRRTVIKPLGYWCWVGNWCWDQVTVSDHDGMRLLRLLCRMGFKPDSGTERMWKWYERRMKARA